MAQNHSHVVVAAPSSSVMVPKGFNEDVELIKRTYASGLTDAELSLFMADANSRGLSIVKKQIYAVKYKDRMNIMVGIDGYRAMAESHPDYAGQDGPYWCGDDGVWKDVWLSSDKPVAAKVGIYRKGFQAPVSAVALWSEYNGNNNMWNKFPTVMLAKCAEAQAIRKAFPDKLGGTYIAEEMDQASHPTRGTIDTTGRPVSRGHVTAAVESLDEKRKKNAADLWKLANGTFGWDKETLDLVAVERTSFHLADLDTDQLKELYMDLVGTSPEEREEILRVVMTPTEGVVEASQT